MPSERQMQEYIERILTNNPGYDRAREKQSKQLLKIQVDTLNRYYQFLANKPSSRGGTTKTASINSTLSRLKQLGLYINKAYEDATKEDLINYAKSMKNLKDTTKSISLLAMRSLYKWLNGMHKPHEIPTILDDPLLKAPSIKVNKSPQALLTRDEIKKMLDVAGNNRNRCLIMLSLGEGGCRASEIVSANLDSIEFDDRGLKFYTEKSKSKMRFIRLIDAEPYFRDYLNNGYALDKTNKKNPLFYAMSSFTVKDRLEPNAVSSILKRIAEKAGINKRVYCHLGRDINITRLNKMGMGSELIAKRHGITIKTMQNVYLRLDDKDVDEAYTKIKDKLTDDEKKRLMQEEKILTPKICPRCRERFPGNPTLWRHPANDMVCSCGFMLDGSNEADLKKEFFSYMAQQFMQASEKEPDLSMREFMRMVKEKI